MSLTGRPAGWIVDMIPQCGCYAHVRPPLLHYAAGACDDVITIPLRFITAYTHDRRRGGSRHTYTKVYHVQHWTFIYFVYTVTWPRDLDLWRLTIYFALCAAFVLMLKVKHRPLFSYLNILMPFNQLNFNSTTSYNCHRKYQIHQIRPLTTSCSLDKSLYRTERQTDRQTNTHTETHK